MSTVPERVTRCLQDHPYGFVAKPITKPDGSCDVLDHVNKPALPEIKPQMSHSEHAADTCAGSVDLLHWKCMIPGKAGTIWDKGLYPVSLIFTESYPSKPPECKFPPGFFHPNGMN